MKELLRKVGIVLILMLSCIAGKAQEETVTFSRNPVEILEGESCTVELTSSDGEIEAVTIGNYDESKISVYCDSYRRTYLPIITIIALAFIEEIDIDFGVEVVKPDGTRETKWLSLKVKMRSLFDSDKDLEYNLIEAVY